MKKPVNVLDHRTASAKGQPLTYGRKSAMLGSRLGATALGASLYDVEPGQSICPYHYELGREEWLLVLVGEPTIRTPDGERVLEPWDVVCFPEGSEGAHKVTNRSQGPVRVLILSTKEQPVVWVYPDSKKLGVSRLPGFFELDRAVSYWHGELAEPDA